MNPFQGGMSGPMADNCGCGETPPFVESPIPVKSGWSPDPSAPTGNLIVDRLTGAANNPQSILAGMGLGPSAKPQSPEDQIRGLLETGMKPLSMTGRNPLMDRMSRGGSPVIGQAPDSLSDPQGAAQQAMQAAMPPMMPGMSPAMGAPMMPGMQPMLPPSQPGMQLPVPMQQQRRLPSMF